ncbi:type 1 glutamine amidotransferase [Acaryochloris marina]|uniref:type 1 glutamine amidotransferase n=1 Tax=Acaryochloris marina TaxID=155978 RepID=UPI0021C46AB5|nr:amidotransferase [Acaryochloris marina]BDM83290.1 amidotransferase [Acaryochloris marina MBIC10699]
MHTHYLQHVPFEGLGNIEPWLKANGSTITGTRFFESVALPDPNESDLLIVMGGPMSVNDEDDFPWLIQEKQFIRRAVEAGKSVLGICLGAQLIASAMGARVYRNPVKEIGWFSIQGIAPTGDAVFCFPPSVEVFHWHGETFDLPSGVVRLARSEGCENQAFQLGQSVIGLQFHLDTTPESARDMVSHCRSELEPSKYVQTESAILSVNPDRYHTIDRLMIDVLSFLTETVD